MVCFFPLNSIKSSLFIQASLLPYWLVLWHIGMACSCAFQLFFLKNVQPSCTPCPSGLLPKGLSQPVPWTGQSLEGQGRSFVTPFHTSLRIENSHFKTTMLKTDSNHISHQPFSVHKQQGPASPSSSYLWPDAEINFSLFQSDLWTPFQSHSLLIFCLSSRLHVPSATGKKKGLIILVALLSFGNSFQTVFSTVLQCCHI